jgi:N-acyl-D-aspartate/D-glutamate deacylase
VSSTESGAAGKTAITNVRVSGGRELRGLGDRGAVGPGRRADLVLLDGDPLRDIRATRSIRRVWCGGIERVPLTRG